MFQVSYTAAGVQGLKKDTASRRKAAVQAVIRSLGGKLEAFYFAFGSDDAVLIASLPGKVAAAAVAATTAASGLVTIRTTPLITIEEMDEGAPAGRAYSISFLSPAAASRAKEASTRSFTVDRSVSSHRARAAISEPLPSTRPPRRPSR